MKNYLNYLLVLNNKGIEMPNSYIKKLSRENNIPIINLERLWSEAKKEGKKNWKIIMTIFQNKLKKHYNINESRVIIEMITFYSLKCLLNEDYYGNK